jgi:hypothetical protein
MMNEISKWLFWPDHHMGLYHIPFVTVDLYVSPLNIGLSMSKLTRRKWRILCWNVCGLNSENRRREVRSKIEESECDIISLQETKFAIFDWRLIRKFCPKHFDSFAYSPSVGASVE